MGWRASFYAVRKCRSQIIFSAVNDKVINYSQPIVNFSFFLSGKKIEISNELPEWAQLTSTLKLPQNIAGELYKKFIMLETFPDTVIFFMCALILVDSHSSPGTWRRLRLSASIKAIFKSSQQWKYFHPISHIYNKQCCHALRQGCGEDRGGEVWGRTDLSWVSEAKHESDVKIHVEVQRMCFFVREKYLWSFIA